MSQLPYRDIRILEQSHTLTGRLVGLLFADQGADVFIERDAGGNGATPGGHDVTRGGHDAYLDRNKIAVPPGGLADTSSADIIIGSPECAGRDLHRHGWTWTAAGPTRHLHATADLFRVCRGRSTDDFAMSISACSGIATGWMPRSPSSSGAVTTTRSGRIRVSAT